MSATTKNFEPQTWLNEPASWTRRGGTIEVVADARTDFWRKTHDGGIRDNGHFLFARVDGDFTLSVRVSGQYASQYDQAGLMVRADASTWLKCGIEYVDGRQLASAVVTRDWSDWSVVAIGTPSSTRWRVRRRGGTCEVAYAVDGGGYELLRQAPLTEQESLDIGVMACAPKGDGFRVSFDEIAIDA